MQHGWTPKGNSILLWSQLQTSCYLVFVQSNEQGKLLYMNLPFTGDLPINSYSVPVLGQALFKPDLVHVCLPG